MPTVSPLARMRLASRRPDFASEPAPSNIAQCQPAQAEPENAFSLNLPQDSYIALRMMSSRPQHRR
ncbi:hypothetical protein MJ561_27145 [Klebsiella pneumoniae]|nr:hypothetical protein MJ561_27145 [Klebsiella pneumoniae]